MEPELQPDQESLLRTALKNEITWLGLLIAAIMAFVYNVIIPVNSIQLQLLQIQQDIATIKSYDTRITSNSNAIIQIQTEINNKKAIQ